MKLAWGVFDIARSELRIGNHQSGALRKFLAAAFMVTVLVEPSHAADPAARWSGLYSGVHLDFSRAKDEQSVSWGYPAVTSPSGDAFVLSTQHSRGAGGGVLVGWNSLVATNYVVGLEADIQAINLKSASTSVGTAEGFGPFPQTATLTVVQSTPWFGTIRARLGVAPPSSDILVYATGGLAFGYLKNVGNMASRFPTFDAVAVANDAVGEIRYGWTLGGGLEVALSKQWSFKTEYLYTDFGNSKRFGRADLDSNVGDLFVYSRRSSDDFHTVRTGLNFRF